MKKGTKLVVRITAHHENAVKQDVMEMKVTFTRDVDDKEYYENLILDAIDVFKDKYNHIYQPREVAIKTYRSI